MMMNKQICRLCLQTTSGNYQAIGGSLPTTLKLNMDISKEVVKCIECTNKLEVFLKFKLVCECTREQPLPTALRDGVIWDPDKIENADNLISRTESKNETTCCFCTKTSERECLTSLRESKEDMFLVDVLKKHIPKLNINTTEELLTCEICIHGLQLASSFIMKCLDVEQKINKYIEINGMDEGQIDLKNVQQFEFDSSVKFETESSAVNELKDRSGQFQERCTMQSEAEIKYEKDIEHPELIIKSEYSDSDSFQESPTTIKLDNVPLDAPVRQPLRRHKECVNQYELTYRNSDGITMYKCETCPYEAKRRTHLRRHKLIHKSISELSMFKCELCPYKAKRREHLTRHTLIHKSKSELRMFKCELCPYEAIRRETLKQHTLTHKSTSELTMYKCELCSFETKHRYYLKTHELIHKGHKLTHKDPKLTQECVSEIMYKCAMCSYKTKYKHSLKVHMLHHSSDATVFKCELCPYQTKSKQYIKQHGLTHKSTMFKCALCSYEAKRKFQLKQHVLIHRRSSDVTMFKCELCPYETRLRSRLNQHQLIHKSISDVTIFKCEKCTFETRHKSNLKAHKLLHRSSSDATMHQILS